MSSTFTGFPKETTQFLTDLKDNNEKEWFDAHKSDFNKHVVDPARSFVSAMGERLREIAPDIIADPRVNKSIFRIYRDVRFSKDKTPYKAHLGIWMWEGYRPKLENSGFYIHIEPPIVMLGTGMYQFTKPLLEQYRQSVVHNRYGASLIEALQQVDKVGSASLGGKHYKRIPRGYDANHERAELLLYNGLHVSYMSKDIEWIHSSEVIDDCFNKFRDMLPIHKWLLEMTRRIDG